MAHRWISRSWLSLAIAATGASAGAQELDASHYDGTWTARVPCVVGNGSCPARLVLRDFEGTWQDLSGKAAAQRLCGGRTMRLTVQRSTREMLGFTVFGDGVSASCPTLSILVKPVDAKTLEGTYLAGRHAMESPEVHASHAGASDAGHGGKAAGGDGAAKRIRLQRR